MAYERVAGNKTFIKLDDHKEGDILLTDAKYIGVEDNQFGGQNLVFSTPEGLVGISKGKILGDWVTNGVFKTGVKYQMTFLGKKNNKAGDRSFATFDLAADSSDMPKTAEPVPASSSSGLADDLQL